MSELNREEIERYQRHLSLPQFGQEAQMKLKQAQVTLVAFNFLSFIESGAGALSFDA